jgi:SAM-dependent methyltransferase
MKTSVPPEDLRTDPITNKSDIFHTEFKNRILPFANPFSCNPNEAILLHGDDAHSFYYIAKGTVEVSYIAKDTKITVALIGAGSFFGEIGFFDQGSRTRDIIAMEQSDIHIFNQKVMDQLRQNEPLLFASLMLFLTKDICIKFRKILEEHEPLTAFAASLTNRKRQYEKTKILPDSLLRSKPWRQINQNVESVKSQLYDLSHTLQAVVEDDIPKQYLTQGYKILDTLNNGLSSFSELMPNLEDKDHMWGFVFKEIFPYLMRSRFAERAYYKPKGYAGDFLMMEHIYQNTPKGDGKIGRLIDGWGLQLQSMEAIRGRRILMKDQLHHLSKKRLEKNKSFSVMNLACGPCRELFDFLRECEYTEKIDALCVDIDTEALQYSNQNVNNIPHNASVRYMSENLVKWALGKVSHDIGAKDLIYSAGLFDYLEPRLFCKLVDKCHEHLKPGGSLLIGNFAPHKDMLFMDHLLHWKLIYRTGEELKELFKDTKFGGDVTILEEPEKVNLFVLAHKN